MNIIDRNIAKLEQQYLTNLQYIDIDYRGEIPGGGDPTLRGASVIANDYKLWLQSNKADYNRRFQLGGFFDSNLKDYSMDIPGAEALVRDLTQETRTQFPHISILSIDAIPGNRRWKITVAIKDMTTGQIGVIDEELQVE
jgi:hypothetical protein